MTRKYIGVSQFVPPSEGPVAARLKTLAFLGWHRAEYKGESGWRELVGLEWEVAERGPQGQPLTVLEEVTYSTGLKAKLRSRIKALIGQDPDEGMDLAELLGQVCLITIEHRKVGDLVFANVVNAIPLPKAMDKGIEFLADSQLTLFDIAENDPVVLATLPKRFQRRISEGTPERPMVSPKPTMTAPANGEGRNYELNF